MYSASISLHTSTLSLIALLSIPLVTGCGWWPSPQLGSSRRNTRRKKKKKKVPTRPLYIRYSNRKYYITLPLVDVGCNLICLSVSLSASGVVCPVGRWVAGNERMAAGGGGQSVPTLPSGQPKNPFPAKLSPSLPLPGSRIALLLFTSFFHASAFSRHGKVGWELANLYKTGKKKKMIGFRGIFFPFAYNGRG